MTQDFLRQFKSSFHQDILGSSSRLTCIFITSEFALTMKQALRIYLLHSLILIFLVAYQAIHVAYSVVQQ